MHKVKGRQRENGVSILTTSFHLFFKTFLKFILKLHFYNYTLPSLIKRRNRGVVFLTLLLSFARFLGDKPPPMLQVLFVFRPEEQQANETNETNQVDNNTQQASAPQTSTTVTVSPNVHDALRNMDALAYVVNSQLYSNWAQLDKTDLHLLQSVCDEKVPLLIMSSIASADKERIACADMIDILQLNKLERPWLITDVIESSLSGVEEGFTWLCEKVGK